MDDQKKTIAVDLDATLATYERGSTEYDPTHIGEPIMPMVDRVKRWLADGCEVVIFTARAWPLGTSEEKQTPDRGSFDDPERYLRAHYEFERNGGDDRTAQAKRAVEAIKQWCRQYIGQELTVTCIKTPAMTEIWDDRAVAVEPNKGKPLNRPELQ